MADDGAKGPLAGRRAVERRIRREDRPEQLHWIAQARCLAATLDLLPQPIVLLVPASPLQVWHANAAARRQLAGEGIVRMRDGRLSFADRAHDDQLHAAVRQARTAGPGLAQVVELRQGERLAATIQLQSLDFGPGPGLPVSEVLMVELHEKASIERGLQRLCDEYLMTRKEAECAIGLYAMGSLDQFARCAGKSIHTVRSQIKAAMHKTATHNQASLVALVAARLGD